MTKLTDLLKKSVANQPKKAAKKALKDSTIAELMKELTVVETELKTRTKFKVKFRNSPVLVDGKAEQAFPIGAVTADEYLEAVVADPKTKKALKAVVDRKIANFEKALPEAKRAEGLAKLKKINKK